MQINSDDGTGEFFIMPHVYGKYYDPLTHTPLFPLVTKYNIVQVYVICFFAINPNPVMLECYATVLCYSVMLQCYARVLCYSVAFMLIFSFASMCCLLQLILHLYSALKFASWNKLHLRTCCQDRYKDFSKCLNVKISMIHPQGVNNSPAGSQ